MTNFLRRVTRATVLALLASSAGCFTSKSARAVARSETGTGAPATVWLKDGRAYEGELLAVSDSLLTLMVRNRIVTGRLAEVNAISFITRQDATRALAAGAWSSPTVMDELRTRSRFPYGISPTVMATLLAATGQSSPDPFTPPAR